MHRGSKANTVGILCVFAEIFYNSFGDRFKEKRKKKICVIWFAFTNYFRAACLMFFNYKSWVVVDAFKQKQTVILDMNLRKTHFKHFSL